MPDTPTMRAGDQIGDFSAGAWNELVRRVDALYEVAPQAGGNVIVKPTVPPVADFPREITVVVTAEPAEDADTVQCRRVRFATIPPGPEIMIVGPVIQAYPDFGSRPADYADAVTETVDENTLFFEAVYRNGYWRIIPRGTITTSGRIAALPYARKFRLAENGAAAWDTLIVWGYNEERDASWIPEDPADKFRMRIKKPPLLQRLPFDQVEGAPAVIYDNATHHYQNHTERTRRNLDQQDMPIYQSIRPTYYGGDIITAVRTEIDHGRRTGMVVVDPPDDYRADELHVMGGTGDPFPLFVPPSDIGTDPGRYRDYGLVFPELSVHTPNGVKRAQLWRITTPTHDQRSGVLSIEPDPDFGSYPFRSHGLGIGDTVPLIEWSAELVDANDGRSWQKYLPARDVLIVVYTAEAMQPLMIRIQDDFEIILERYPGQDVRSIANWTGNIHDYGLVVCVLGYRTTEEIIPFAELPFSSQILSGAWTGRVCLIGELGRNGANLAVNQLAGHTGMSIGTDESTAMPVGDEATAEEGHILTQGIDSIYSGKVLNVDGGAPLSKALYGGILKPWLAEATVNGVSWVVSGGERYMRGEPPWSPTGAYRNWRLLINLVNARVGVE